ncbi:MAG: gliding motility lipoprotein GldH [Paludibacter sp.]|nr:gliding motility lipoprotein GldH [Paludibacter sp.]
MNKTTGIIKNLLLLILPALIFSCSNNDIYFQYYTVPVSGWSRDSSFVFDINIPDTQQLYNVYVNVRNRGEYPQQNLWLFIRQTTPDSTVIGDTINFYLADQRGKWLGSGVGATFKMPVLYQQGVRFSKTGIYKFSINQGMRYDILPGINDIGMRVEKAE